MKCRGQALVLQVSGAVSRWKFLVALYICDEIAGGNSQAESNLQIHRQVLHSGGHLP